MMPVRIATCSRSLVAVVALLSMIVNAEGQFLSRSPDSERRVTRQEVESDIQALQEAAMLGGDSKVAQRLAKIEASIWRTFQALPKNSIGRLAPGAVRYIVHNYFAKEHGWLIKGLEPNALQAKGSDVHDVGILQDQAPAFVEALMESKQQNRGLSLKDVAVVAAALERLIIEDEMVLLEASYALNYLSSDQEIDEGSLHEVLRSFLLIYEVGRKVNLTDISKHQAKKARLAKSTNNAGWLAIIEFEHDAVLNYGYRHRHTLNPFAHQSYSFQEASAIVESLVQDYGKWQNMECRQMKDALMDLKPDGFGRVPLKTFYSKPDGADFQFTESPEYLREIGALEEGSLGNQAVLIANYVTGPSNCIASSAYYSVCCLSDCEGIMNDIEGAVQGPTATPQQLLGLVGNISSPTVDAPWEVPRSLTDRLYSIAAQRGGQVHLHGRLFAQWLHFAFPNDCGLPYFSEDADVLLPGHWSNNKDRISPEDRQKHVQAPDVDFIAPEPLSAALWSEDEVLPFAEASQSRKGSIGSNLRTFLRLAVMCALATFVLRIALAGWSSARRLSDSRDEKKQAKDFSSDVAAGVQFV